MPVHTKSSRSRNLRSSQESNWLTAFKNALIKHNETLAKDIDYATAEYLYSTGKFTPDNAAQRYGQIKHGVTAYGKKP